MKTTNIYTGSLSTIVMKLLNEHDSMYGYQIVKRVIEITHGELQITEGALYPCLHKLEAAGFVEVSYAMIGRRTRKYYKLTEKGTRETVKKLAELERYIQNMRALIHPKFRQAE
ncbi:PadR family transcriptional regulator [Gaetbulibacter aestuarii]|uniref:PadR family transcriptional regulator n=1 Tax=Gaetbulibacter aestuarii TaxID=1502358 RepID=A0ABW7MUQ0_9FLAO